MTTKEIYAVMRIDKSIFVGDERIQLPEGKFIIPAFEDYMSALECSGYGKFQIVILQQQTD